MGYNDMKFATEISKAILSDTKQILLPDGKVLYIPVGQKCGTDFQKQIYANIKAIEIIDKMEEDKNK